MKTEEELQTLKTQLEDLKQKLEELNDEELEAVCGGGSAEYIRPVMLLVRHDFEECKFEHNTAKGEGGAIQFEEPHFYETPFFKGKEE